MTNTTVSFSDLDTIISKICHDLISPIGAVHNGLEVLEDMGAEPEVIALVDYSANQASAKLMAFRMAYGAGGNDAGLKPEVIYTVINDLINGDNKITQDWDAHDPTWFDNERGEGFGKILIGLLMLGIECLPKGGTLTATRTQDGITVLAAGTDARLRPESLAILETQESTETLNPQAVHAFMSVHTAARFGYTLAADTQTPDQVTLTATETSPS